MRILIIDDDFVGRSKLKAILSQYGECSTASSGELGLNLFETAHKERAPFDLITLDYEMPGMKGTMVVRRIRDWEARNHSSIVNPEVNVIMVTGSHEDETVKASFKGGCQGYLSKPITKDRLKAALMDVGLLQVEAEEETS